MTELTDEAMAKDDLAVILLLMPATPSFVLLSEARDYCLSLMHRLEAILACGTPRPRKAYPYEHPESGEISYEPYGGELAYRAADYMQQAKERLAFIDNRLSTMGYDPERCGWGI